MKTRLLIIIAILVVLYPLIPLVQYHMGNQVMVDGMTVSGSIVLLTSLVFSVMSWFLLTWASKSIKVIGIPLSIISSAVLMIPFYDILGPMAAVIIGVVAGFIAFMFYKHMANRDKRSLIITIATVAISYLALTIMIVLVSNTPHVWDTGGGIGGWSGTDDGKKPTQVINSSFNLDYVSFETLEKIWITILVIPGIIILYKFYERLKLKYQKMD